MILKDLFVRIISILMQWIGRIRSLIPPEIQPENGLEFNTNWSGKVCNVAQMVIDCAKEAAINKEQCFLLSRRCCELLEYIRYWKAFFQEEIDSPATNRVGDCVVLVLERALELVKKYRTEAWLHSAVIWQENPNEFMDILEDMTEYIQMLNRLLECLVSENQEKVQQIKQLQTKVKYDGVITLTWLKQHSHNDFSELLRQVRDLYMTSGIKGSLIKHLQKMIEERINASRLEPIQIPFIDMKGVNYLPSGFLGKGGFGIVKKATFLGLPVAVKEMATEARSNEQDIMASLQPSHPQVVQLIGVYRANDKICLAMELLEKDLEKLIRERKRPDNASPFLLEDAVDIMLQIAKGMDYLHRNLVIYRDMKPSNMLVNKKVMGVSRTEYFQVKLADFGRSKANFHSDSLNTRPVGTRRYMAPEMSSPDGRSYSFSTDIYSFGVTCYQILTGDFSALEPVWPPETPQKLCELLGKCCQKNPENRPTDFGVILKSLWKVKEEILTNMGSTSLSTTDDTLSSTSSVSGNGIEGLIVQTEAFIGKEVTAQWSCSGEYKIFVVQWDRLYRDGTSVVIMEKPIIIEHEKKASYTLNANDLDAKIRVHCLPISKYGLGGQRKSATIDKWVSCDLRLCQQLDKYLACGKAEFSVCIDGSTNTNLYLNSEGYRFSQGPRWNRTKFAKDYSSLEIRLGLKCCHILRLKTEENIIELAFEDPWTCNLAALTMKRFKQMAGY